MEHIKGFMHHMASHPEHLLDPLIRIGVLILSAALIWWIYNRIITKVALELDWVMKAPAPKVVVRNFGESAVDLQARVWISDPRRRMDTISYLTDRVKEVFDEEGIEIPYPKRDITIRKEIEAT